MSLNVAQLRDLVVRPALRDIGLHSQAAEDLVMGTGAQESRLEYIKQIRGPALGLFQVEPATYFDYWDNFIDRRPELRDAIFESLDVTYRPPVERVVHDLRFAAMMCRIHYRRIRAPLPPEGDVEAMAAYWKRYYNTVHGRGTEEEFVRNYRLVAE